MAKKVKNKNLKNKKFAYGGTAFNIETPEETSARITKDMIEAAYQGLTEGSGQLLGDIGGLLANTGMKLVTSGVGQAGGFGKVLGSNDKLSKFGKGLDSILGIKTGEAGIGKIDKVLPGAEIESITSDISRINSIDNYTLPNSFGGGKGFGKSKVVPNWLKDNYDLFVKPPFSLPSFALGGTASNVPIEAEGGEVVETPGGIPQELVGPSHEGGGMDMLVPPGTDIYSKRVKGPDGKSMADRKKERERKETKLRKLLEKNKGDKTLQKTLEKVQQDNAIEDAQDMEYMRSLQEQQMVLPQQEFALGGSVLDYTEPTIPELVITKKKNRGLPYITNIEKPVINTSGIIDTPKTFVPETVIEVPTNDAKEDNPSFLDTLKNIKHPLKDATLGDLIGIHSNIKGAREQMKNTLEQYKRTPLEKNHYKDYGKEALGVIRDQYGILEGLKENALQDLELNRNSQIARNNNSARGLNTLRALNMATDAQVNKSQRDIHNNLASQKLAIMDKEAAQLDEINSKVMHGEEMRADRELKNQDNFFTNMGQNIADKYRAERSVGDALNNIKERKIREDFLANSKNYVYNPYTGKMEFIGEKDSGFEKNEKGELIRGTSTINEYTKEGKPTKKFLDKLNNENKGLWEGITNPITGKPFTSAEEFADLNYKYQNNSFYKTKYGDIKYPHTEFINPQTNKPFENLNDYKKAQEVYGKDFKFTKFVENNLSQNSDVVIPLLKRSLTQDESKTLEKVSSDLGIKVDLQDSKSIEKLQKKLGMPKKYQTGKFGSITLKYINKMGK